MSIKLIKKYSISDKNKRKKVKTLKYKFKYSFTKKQIEKNLLYGRNK